MQKGPLIGAALLGVTALGVVAFFFVMSGGDTGEDLNDYQREVHQVEDLATAGTNGEVVGTRPATERPEDPVEAKLQGQWNNEVHGELTQSDWDEVKAVQAVKSRQVMEGIIEGHLSGSSGDKAVVRAAFEEVQVQSEAINAEVREGYLNPRQARKKHDAVQKAAEEAVVGALGASEAAELRAKLGAKRMRFF